jgi:hypothetical protein
MQLRSKSSISASYLEKTNGLAQGLAFLVELTSLGRLRSRPRGEATRKQNRSEVLGAVLILARRPDALAGHLRGRIAQPKGDCIPPGRTPLFPPSPRRVARHPEEILRLKSLI